MRTHLRATAALACALGLGLPLPASAEEEAALAGEAVFGPQWYAAEERPGSAKFGEFRDVPNGFVGSLLRLSWTPVEKHYFELDAVDVGQADQRIGVRFGRTDLWKASLRWSENPRLWTDQASQLWTRREGAVFTLDDGLQSAIQAAPASADTMPQDGFWDAGTKGALLRTAVLSGASDVALGYRRTRGGAGVEITPTRSWTFSLDVDRERRSGSNPQSLGFYFTLGPGEVAAPIDFRTDWVTGRAEYARDRWNAGVKLTASRFDTEHTTLVWDNQLFLNDTASNATTASPARGRMLLGVDSDLFQATVYGGVNLPGRTRIDVTLSDTKVTQDDPLLPMTTNSLLATAPLPAARFDGEYRNVLANVRVSSRPLSFLRWSAWWRDFEYDNESPSLVFRDYVMTDYQIPLCSNVNACDANGDLAANDRIARRTLPYGYGRTNTGALVGWSPLSWLDASLSYEREAISREHSAVEDSGEDIYKLTVDLDVGERLGVRATARRQERRADHYDAHYFEESFPIGEPYVAGFNEGMRRFYWTDRDRDAYGLTADWTLNPAVSVYAEAIHSDDDYMDPETGRAVGDSFTVREDRDFDGTAETYSLRIAGRTEDKATSYTLGVALAPHRRVDLHADYTWERSEYGFETRYRCPGTACGAVAANIGSDNPLDDWGSDVEDRYRTASLGVDVVLSEKNRWRLWADASRSRGTGEIETHFVPGGHASGNTTLTRFPELRTTLTLANVRVSHRIRTNFEYALLYWYEAWREDNFASDFMRPWMGDPTADPGSANAAYLGFDFRDYENHILSLMMRYTF
jgi:MtrB/PioB family decaheme-associated outer membrane protein